MDWIQISFARDQKILDSLPASRILRARRVPKGLVLYLRRTYRAQRIVPWTPVQVYDLVADVESYPDFLPGWRHASVVNTRGNCAEVSQQVGIGPFSLRFLSVATFLPHSKITICSRAKPFAQLDLCWSFDPAGDGCRVELAIDVAFRARALALSLAPVLDALTQRVMTAFERRARDVYQR